MTYGIILCAGNQTRFNSSTPKALVNIGGNILLDINIKNMKKYCDEVYIVVSEKNKGFFINYDNVIVIDSGLGCGDAVFKAISAIKVDIDDTCFIVWGDSLQDSLVYAKCKDAYVGTIVVPCVTEEKPYVQIVQTSEDKLTVKFSKFNDDITYGYHDLCIFYGNAFDIYKHCKIFRDKFYNGITYNHKHNEFSFLDIFNDTPVKGKILDVGNIKSISFNSLEDLDTILKEIL